MCSSSKVQFYCGGGAEIGKSFYLLRFDYKHHLGDSSHYLGVDWGAGGKNMNEEPFYDGTRLDYLFISHAHFDHCGMVPRLITRFPKIRLFATAETKDLCEIAWNQSLYIASENNTKPYYSQEEINQTLERIEIIHPEREVKLGQHLSVIPISAGHILGAVYFMIIYKKDTFIITSDICLRDRSLIRGAKVVNLEYSRLLVRESTYVNTTFEKRSETTENLIASVRQTLARGGSVLIPALSVDRTQDIFTILNEAGISPIFIDGSKSVTDVYAKYLGNNDLTSANRFKDKKEKIELLSSKKPFVVIASSGMLIESTASAFWAEQLAPSPKNAVLLVSYQDPEGQGTKFAITEQDNFLTFNKITLRRACEVKSFNFSAHISGPDGENLEGCFRPYTIIYGHGSRNEIRKYIARKNDKGKKRRLIAEIGRWEEV